MNEFQTKEYVDEINIREYLSVLRPAWWKIISLSLLVGIVSLIIFFQLPDMYRATAVISPVSEEVDTSSLLGSVGSTFGLSIGGSNKLEDLESLLTSKDLTDRVFSEYNLWPIVFPEDFDTKTGKLKVGWIDRLNGEKEDYKKPDDWDAIRAAEDRLRVSINNKAGTLSISFESPSPEGSADITSYYIEEAKSRLQEEVLDRASKNKKFIKEQIDKTVDALTRDRLFSLFGQEVEKEMLAKNREQFGFIIIDHPRVPDRKSGPPRFLGATVLAFLSSTIWCVFFIVRGKRNTIKHSKNEEEGQSLT